MTWAAFAPILAAVVRAGDLSSQGAYKCSELRYNYTMVRVIIVFKKISIDPACLHPRWGIMVKDLWICTLVVRILRNVYI